MQKAFQLKMGVYKGFWNYCSMICKTWAGMDCVKQTYINTRTSLSRVLKRLFSSTSPLLALYTSRNLSRYLSRPAKREPFRSTDVRRANSASIWQAENKQRNTSDWLLIQLYHCCCMKHFFLNQCMLQSVYQIIHDS